MNWLDTETKSILRKEPELKLAPPRAAEFGLVLLRKGADHERLVRAVCRINECNDSEAMELIRPQTPVIINPGLTEGEALFGQFELICCDAISAFIRSEVLLEQGQRNYLHTLFQRVLDSSEFRPTPIKILEVPETEPGLKFLDQFVGLPALAVPSCIVISVPLKKARIMQHWASRVGARVECGMVGDSNDEGDTL